VPGNGHAVFLFVEWGEFRFLTQLGRRIAREEDAAGDGLFVALGGTRVAVGALDNIALQGPEALKGLTLDVTPSGAAGRHLPLRVDLKKTAL
jgi:hypothetical protein